MLQCLENVTAVVIPGGTTVQEFVSVPSTQVVPNGGSVTQIQTVPLATSSGGSLFDILISVLLLALLLALHLIAAFVVSSVVVKKGYTVKETHAFAKCFWLGIAGWFYVLALPTLKTENPSEDYQPLYAEKNETEDKYI